MKIYLNGTANLGDFLNGLPVMSGISKAYGKFELVVKKEMKKFKGLKEFLMYQDLFTEVNFDDELFLYGDIITMSSWPIREDKGDPYRPTETCRYENFMKDRYKMDLRDLVVVPDDYSIELERVREFNKKIDEEIQLYRISLDTIEMRIQLASDRTLQNLINEVDDMGELKLIDTKLKMLN